MSSFIMVKSLHNLHCYYIIMHDHQPQPHAYKEKTSKQIGNIGGRKHWQIDG